MRVRAPRVDGRPHKGWPAVAVAVAVVDREDLPPVTSADRARTVDSGRIRADHDPSRHRGD